MALYSDTQQQPVAPRRNWFQRHPRRTKVLAAAILILIIAVALWLALKPEKKNEVSNNPVIASYQKQLPELADKVQDNPKDPQALQDYAVALYATGDIKGAQKQYEALVSVSSKDATARNNLGNVYRDLGDYDKAVDSYQEAIKLDAKNVNAYTNLANLYIYTLNKKDLGIKTYQEALKNLPDNVDVQVLLGIAYEQNDDKANARQWFEKVLAADPDNAAAAAGLKRVG
jgi:tetratricopeptide (TPR) repeat protein